MEGDEADVEVGGAGVDHGMGNGDNGNIQDIEMEEGVEAGGAGIDAEQGMEIDNDAGVELPVENGDDAGDEEAVENGNGAGDEVVAENGYDTGDEEAMEYGNGAGEEEDEEAVENGNGAGDEVVAENGYDDTGDEEAMEYGNGAGDEEDEEAVEAVENVYNAGDEMAVENDDDSEDDEAVQNGDDAGVEQAVGEDDAVVNLHQEMVADVGLLLLPENHLLPPIIPEYEASPHYLILQLSEFQRSGALETIVLLGDRDVHGDGPPETVGPLFRNGDYSNIDTILPEETTVLINQVFNAKTHAVIETVLSDGRRIQLDFLRKVCVQVDEERTPLRFVAMYWVDNQHRVFVSARIFGMDEVVVRQRLMEECNERLVITAVQRCFHHLDAMNPFCERIQSEDPVFGWYGSGAQAVEHGAFQDGALYPNWQLLEVPGFERAHGHGIHIAPIRRIMKSALISVASGQPGHMLLCALALGSTEIVPEGSEQDSPSSPLFQSGVVIDELGDTAWHIIWETSGPGFVLPLYMVTFIVPARQ